tara:strand:- start:295 stop:699 length:405 start_codon:yes stop_codon:yes gene_type:complete
MIYGIGTDIININRVKEVIHTYENNFLLRFFSSNEIKESKDKRNKNLFFAERFSAKEAFWKAVSPNNNVSINFKDVEILPYFKNTEIINLLGKTNKIFKIKEKRLNKKFKYHVTLSNAPPNVLTYVIIYLTNPK